MSVVCAPLILGCVTGQASLGGDYERLEGTWIVTYDEAFGWPVPERKGALFVFSGDRVKRSTDEGDQQFALDESATPKRIDFRDPPAEDVLGIYRLEGDELVICTNGANGSRPTLFRTGLFRGGTVLTRFRRQSR